MADTNNKKQNEKTSWTSAQENAIFDVGSGLLVSAAAGSGKTAVLVERAVQMMIRESNPVRADKILIVTFTRAAAQELRSRISLRLTKELAKNPNNLSIKKQRTMLGRANICTIDAFCMQLLQSYFVHVNIPADFEIADEATVYELRNTCIDKTLQEMYKNDDFCEFASMYGRAKNDNNVVNALLSLYNYAQSTKNPEEFLNNLCLGYEHQIDIENTNYGEILLKNTQEMVEQALAMIKSARGIVEIETQLAKYDTALCEDEAYLIRLKQLVQEKRWDDCVVYVQNYAPANLARITNSNDAKANMVKLLRKKSKDCINSIAKNIFVCTNDEFLQDNKRALPMVNSLISAVKYFAEIFYEHKIEQKVLEYSDLEHLTINLLCDENKNRTKIGSAISAEFDAVMVDEYQDTNEIQSTIYKYLANKDESNLFYVGDVKQSVYSFRLADPEIFIDIRKKFAQYKKDIMEPKTIVLGHNFRSTSNIINQVNDVFSLLMTRQIGDVEYTKGEQLIRGSANEFNGGAIDIKIIETKQENAQSDDVSVVASTVNYMLKSGYKVLDKNGQERACTCEDFCILLRTKSKFNLYEQELAKYKIASFSDIAESYLTSNEVTTFICMLKVIDNPMLDIELAAVLMSALYNFSPDDILQIRQCDKSSRLYAALLKSENPLAVNFCNEIKMFRTLAVTLSPKQLCNEILQSTHYMAAISAMENSDVKRENMRMFMDFVSEKNADGLQTLIRRIDGSVNSNAVGSSNAVSANGSVSIMSIHRSKGLEFPICILADATHEFNLQDLYSPLLFHKNLGLGLKLRQKNTSALYLTAHHAAIKIAKQQQLFSEEMRILYVALTRARQKLIVTMPMKDAQSKLEDLSTQLANTNGNIEYMLKQQRSFGMWLCIFALLHPKCDELRKIAGGNILPLIKAKSDIEVDVLPAKEIEQEIVHSEFVPVSKPDKEFLSKLVNKFEAYEKRDTTLANLPLKLSVSAISHKQQTPLLARPAFTYKQGLTAAEKGTAQHAFLQFANFNNAKSNLKQEINRLVQNNYMQSEIAKKLPENKILAFLNTETCNRIQSAKQLYREYEFITAIPAGYVYEEIGSVHKNANIQVQGIADVVCINDNGIEIIDYKTDKNKTAQDFVNTYSKQLQLYKLAIERRFNLPVVRCTIYSFENSEEINIPL